MTAAKIAITLPQEQLRLVENAVKWWRVMVLSSFQPGR